MLQEKTLNSSGNIRRYYNGIDLIKFICAIMVFIVHIPPMYPSSTTPLSPTALTINYYLQHCLCRFAVPFFYVCSGFFLYQKMPANEIDVERVKKYCFKLFTLLGIWSVILFLGGTGHLWYLGGTVVAVVLLSIFLYHRLNLKLLVVIGCVLYVVGLLGDSYFWVIEPFVRDGIPHSIYKLYRFFVPLSRNGFHPGFIFVLMGYFFAQGKIKIKPGVSLALFCVSAVGIIAEAVLIRRMRVVTEHNMFIFLLPATFFLFAFASSLSLKDNPIYAKLRTVGALVYFMHVFIGRLVSIGFHIINSMFQIDLLQTKFFFTLPLTLLAAFVIEWLSHKEKCKWLRWILP